MPSLCKNCLAAVAVMLLAAALPAVAAGQAPAREAGARHLVLNYEVYVGGFRTASVAYDARYSLGEYDLQVALTGRGILDWWFAWTMSAYSQGRRDGAVIAPVRAGSVSTWNGKRRRTFLNYLPGGPPLVHLEPQPEKDRPATVRAALREGTQDLAGALFALVMRVGNTGRCDGREAVFDGRRRYDLVLTHLGEDRLAASSYSAYAGPALRCGLRMERIAGYSSDGNRSSWQTDAPAVVWIGTPFVGRPPVPVRLEYDTRFGALVGHLVQATLTAEDGVQRLVQAR